MGERGRVDSLGGGDQEQRSVGVAVAGPRVEVRLSSHNWSSSGITAGREVADAFATLLSVRAGVVCEQLRDVAGSFAFDVGAGCVE